MEAVYVECQLLKAKFIQEELALLPEYCWTRDGNYKYLRAEASHALDIKADAYYQQCLDERSIRVPRT